MTKLFLHIGQPKTATTTIQSFLSHNRGALINKGWLYPKTACQYHAHHILGGMFNMNPADWLGRADPQETRDKLLAEIDSTGCHSVVMSSESLFFSKRGKVIREFFEGFDLHIVAFLRRQDEWLESAYQEQRKNGATNQSPAEYLARQDMTLSYADRLATWVRRSGSQSVMVHAFERTAKPQPVEDIFLDMIGAPQDAGYYRPPHQNERLNRDCVAYLSAMTEKRRLGLRFKRIKDILSDYSRLHPDNSDQRHIWPPAERIALVERYSDQNRRVASEFLNRSNGELFSNPLPSESEPWREYPGLKVETAVHIGEYLANRLFQQAGPATNAAEPDSEAGSAQA
ncbi:MAG: hypothetical protein FD162_2983 [Rhodobacteraceae bacterium]|nr:MAG: hypothetical protein FD162_2983 [Paracoccaceae bacterium]